jgi:methyl-accepting chemotaxis protein I, serine sensor receptor
MDARIKLSRAGTRMAAAPHRRTEQLKQVVSVSEIAESVLRTQQPGAMPGTNMEFALSGMHAH